MSALLGRLMIGPKLRLIIVGAAAMALLSSLVLSLGGQALKAEDDLSDQLRTLADVVGKNSVAAITFQDGDQLRLLLNSLFANPSVIASVLSSPSRRAPTRPARYRRARPGARRRCSRSAPG